MMFIVTLAKLKEEDDEVVDLKQKVEKISGTKWWCTPGQYTYFTCPSVRIINSFLIHCYLQGNSRVFIN